MANISAPVGLTLGIVALLALPGCGKKASDDAAGSAGTTITVDSPAGSTAPAPTDVTTLDGTVYASFTGTPAAGEKVFLMCRTCHAVEAGRNMVGPSMHAIQGRTSGTIPGYSYSVANKTSAIVWNNEKLFQYLENPQRVIPGTKMTYTGVKDPQQRADLIAYLDTLR